MNYRNWEDIKSDYLNPVSDRPWDRQEKEMTELNETLRDIGAGLCRESWTKTHDFEVDDQGSIFILTPTSDAGLNWCWEHLNEDAQRWGKFGYVFEHRHIQEIIHGMERDGLVSEWKQAVIDAAQDLEFVLDCKSLENQEGK